MLNLLQEQNYDVLTFTPFVDYVKTLDEGNYQLISNEIDNYFQTIIASNGEEFIKILMFKDKEKEWVSIYRYYEEGYTFEKVEFMHFNDEHMESMKEDYNNVIKYSAHLDDETYSRVICSAFSYKDNELLGGWREKRKIAIEDLPKIYYKGMNLTELIGIADDKIFEFYEVISEKEEVNKLILEY